MLRINKRIDDTIKFEYLSNRKWWVRIGTIETYKLMSKF